MILDGRMEFISFLKVLVVEVIFHQSVLDLVGYIVYLSYFFCMPIVRVHTLDVLVNISLLCLF